MSTKQSYTDYILDQLVQLKNVSVRKMFGEYALYCDNKVVGLICNNSLFIKITPPGLAYVGQDFSEGYPYPGAKASMLINEDQIEDGQWLSRLVEITSDNVKPSSIKKSRSQQATIIK